MKIRHFLIILSSLLLALYAAFIQEYETITQEQAGYATVIVILGAFPCLVSLISRREAGLLPLMQLHGLFYSFTFGLPVFSSKINCSLANTQVLDGLTPAGQGLVNSSVITDEISQLLPNPADCDHLFHISYVLLNSLNYFFILNFVLSLKMDDYFLAFHFIIHHHFLFYCFYLP